MAGGCTSAIAVLANNFLYVANVGDSRVLIIKERPNGTLEAHQLTKDHSVENEAELQRLEALGLRRENLLRAGRLGTQENTRSIGDYNIKEGYRDMDSLRYAWNACFVVQCMCTYNMYGNIDVCYMLYQKKVNCTCVVTDSGAVYL